MISIVESNPLVQVFGAEDLNLQKAAALEILAKVILFLTESVNHFVDFN